MRGSARLWWWEGNEYGVDGGELVFGETGTRCFFSGIYPYGASRYGWCLMHVSQRS